MWRRLHNQEPHYLYLSPNIIRVIESRKMRWAENVVRMREKVGSYRVSFGKPEGKRPLGRTRRGGMILKLTLKKWDREHGRFDLAEDRDRLRAFVNTRVTLPVL
jgi:hypothetical protein